MNRKDHVAWECPRCNHRHLWRWSKGEAAISCDGTPIYMECDKCKAETKTTMARIGSDVYAAVYAWWQK